MRLAVRNRRATGRSDRTQCIGTVAVGGSPSYAFHGTKSADDILASIERFCTTPRSKPNLNAANFRFRTRGCSFSGSSGIAWFMEFEGAVRVADLPANDAGFAGQPPTTQIPKPSTSRFDRAASRSESSSGCPDGSSPPGYCDTKPTIPPTVRTKPMSSVAPALLAEKDRYERSETG